MGAEVGKSAMAHILERLSADPAARAFEILVLAALEGPQALGQALDQVGKPTAKTPPQPVPPPQAAYLKSITVEGFRGIGPKSTLEIKPGPGLTLVVGRNGSGKSSFAEALELLLTDDTYRWAKRTKVWRDGWRNLHHKAASIEAECLIEGKKGATVLKRAWADGHALEEGAAVVQPHGETKTERAALGWDGPLATYRPFLSYNELGSLLDEGPSKLFDALAQILGLDDLVTAEKALADERGGREKAQKDCEAQRAHLVELLKQAEDPRAQALLAVLGKKDRDAKQAEAILEAAENNLTKTIADLQAKARIELQEKEDKWRPTAGLIQEWLALAKDARKKAETAKALKAAEQWLKKSSQELRTERFAPIKDKAQRIWNQLRMQSSVALEDVRLAGSSKQRKVELDVTVDGVEGAALGVMSQGELHALALSLFIPRATLPESPFRFIVIDDPVQSMDPARVDGLARVLQTAAKDHQVVVFTHDDRLPEAVRRLDVKATIVEVTRREGSIVECREANDPVSRYLSDAFSLTKTRNLPSEAARRVIPGFCRNAIEAACAEVIRKRRLSKGLSHAEVEQALERANTKQFAAMALFDDVQRTDDVLKRLNKERKDFADVFQQCQQGAHEDKGVDTLALVKGVENLTKWLRAQA